MDKRLIDKDALLSDIELTITESGCVNHEREIIDCVKYAPTIDAVVPVHGRWIATRAIERDGEICCSVCYTESKAQFETVYCPSCGAIMDGEKESEGK